MDHKESGFGGERIGLNSTGDVSMIYIIPNIEVVSTPSRSQNEEL